MAQAKSWGDVKIGFIALLCTAGAAAAVLTFARVGALHGSTVRLYAATSHARGLLPGSEVWVAGQKVGLVRNIGFRPPSTDTSLRVLLTLDILERERAQIRRDATVTIRPGGSLIGSPVVAIDPAPPASPRASEGDTLYANPGQELESIRTRLTTAVGTEVPLVLDNVRVLGAQLATARGTLGALGIEGPDHIGATANHARALVGRATGGSGTTGLALHGDLAGRAQAIVGRVDALRARLDDPRTTSARLRGSDSTLARTVAHIQADLAEVQRALDEPRGTIGRATLDGILRIQLARTRAELDAIAADVARNPLRYVGF